MADESVGQKRVRDGDEGGAGEKKGKLGDDAMEVRGLVSNYESSVIIGTKGVNVKAIREKTGCLISILKSPEGKTPDRVMSIKGQPAGIIQTILAIAELFVQNKPKKTLGVEQDGLLADTSSVKLLVHKAHAGAIIGSKGSVIKDINQQTGARVQLSNDPLPGSTEKTVTITGPPSAIHQAALRVITQIHENPLRPGTVHSPYVPGRSQFALPGAFFPSFDGFSFGGFPAGIRADSGPEQQQKIAIPTVSAGSVLGKGGAIIADIKNQTGTQIRIAPPDAELPHERVVTVSGSAQGIQAAIALIRQRVEQPHLPWTGGAAVVAPAVYSPMSAVAAPGQYAPNPYGGYYQ